ncbi:Aste57867_13756 [Aphanomyces stellatus]|uniref:Aste57867_13756 protein n=1 Tax=Aphanomyces stellatus TaxID=120398 RepID=A0A485KZ79_9STRA|nr:hypothetical protein As57867_013706 [Aphanomyces stellatus]VFT90589.1 Aste57867_13756 [Aphanomyces stellatus]
MAASPKKDFVALESPSVPRRETALRRRVLQIPIMEEVVTGPAFLYPKEDGVHESVQVPADELAAIRDELNAPRFKLSQWVATAIAGNDVMSSVMYSAGIVVVKGGKLAPFGFALVSVVLYLYRFIYSEAVTAIPLNGGSYNLLLNTTSKKIASVAACLSTLCYLATAVVSATTACFYLKASAPDLPVIPVSIAMLGTFALLMIVGIKESALTAFAIFLFHMMTLTVLVVVCIIYMAQHPDIIYHNYHNTTYPDVEFLGSMVDGNAFTSLFFGFAVAMLGVTGFETSSNFVEEQQPGVFPKTLRNLWALSSVYNVVLCVLGLGVCSIQDIVDHQNAVLAQMALQAGGTWMQWWIGVDAFVVLSGGVLTSYVGIVGLFRRLASDRVLPEFFATQNAWRGTNHWIPTFFFVVATSLVLILDADATTLGGVYTYSFLSLMFLFGSACILLKLKRNAIPRAIKAPWYACFVGMFLVSCGIVGNLLGDPKALMWFAIYFLFVAAIVFSMLHRVFLFRVLIAFVNMFVRDKIDDTGATNTTGQVDPDVQPFSVLPATTKPFERDGHHVALLVRAIRTANARPIVFFIKQANLTVLNKAVLYVRNNEVTSNLRVLHVYQEATPDALETVAALQEMVALMDTLYPKFKIDFYAVVGPFEPATIQWLSHTLHIPPNMMFLKQPSNLGVHKVSSTGARVITG